MIHFTTFNNRKVRYGVEGAGTTIVLLHGYLETLEIWKDFSSDLAKAFRVISVDLPGHGESEIFSNVHSMDLMAGAVKAVLDTEEIGKCVLFGHSLGGYVTLAFADNYPERLLGFSLFHSAPFPDTEEKRANRDREIELVRQGKKELIFKTNIPKGFATDNLQRLSEEVNRAMSLAFKSPDEGIIAILNGMKIRPDRTEIIKNCNVPFLWILGKKDNYILYDGIKKIIEINDKGRVFVLENSGHLGFIEEKDNAIQEVSSFVRNCAKAPLKGNDL